MTQPRSPSAAWLRHAERARGTGGREPPRLIRRFELVDVLHRALVRELRVLELAELLGEAVADVGVVQRPADDLGAALARGPHGEEQDDRALEGAIVLLVEDVVVALAHRRLALL